MLVVSPAYSLLFICGLGIKGGDCMKKLVSFVLPVVYVLAFVFGIYLLAFLIIITINIITPTATRATGIIAISPIGE